MDFTCENQFWALDEQYCVQPKCKCKETVLTFIRYEDSTHRKIVSQPQFPSLRYNYRSQAISEVQEGPSGLPPPPAIDGGAQD